MAAVVDVLALMVGAQSAATPTPTPTPRYVDPSVVSPGLIGFVLFVGLGVATVLLWLSMNRQLKKIDFDESAPADPPPADSAPADSPPADSPPADPPVDGPASQRDQESGPRPG